MLFTSVSLFAQTGGELVGIAQPGVVIDFSTFTGIAAIVSMVVTQLCKLVPVINSKGVYKIITALLSGVAICVLAKALCLQSPLITLSWLESALYGLFAGSLSCGLFDIFNSVYKVIKNLFMKSND